MPRKDKRMGVAEQREQFILGCKFIEQARLKYCKRYDTLGIDPARGSTGWAFFFKNKIQTGVFISKGWGFSKVMYIESKVKQILNQTKPFVGIEGYAHNAKWGREAAGELGGVLRKSFFFYKRPMLVISPLTLKAWLKAKSKSQIMLEILDRYKIKINQEDAADAFVIADIIQKTLHLAHDVVLDKVLPEEVREYMKVETYKRVDSLRNLYKYQATSLFNLIWKNGSTCEFFTESPPILNQKGKIK